MSLKLNLARIDGEPHNSFTFLSAAGVVNSHDELTKRQASFPAIGFHGPKYKPGNHAGDMGCLPHAGFDKNPAPTRQATHIQDQPGFISFGKYIS
jgi:hypothetical protein